MSEDGIDSFVGKRGLFMCRIAGIFLLQRLKGNMSGDARDFNNFETRVVKNLFFPARQGAEGNLRILRETLREHAPLYATVKNWVAQFKPGDFSTFVAPRPGRHKTVATPEIIDQIHELIWKTARFRLNQ